MRVLRRQPKATLVVLAVVGVLVAVNLLAVIVDAATGGVPGGPRGSSYATGGDGLAALYDLLPSAGHPVERLRTRPADGTLDPSTTLVVLDPQDISRREVRALRRFVERGGRLVAGGTDPSWVTDIFAPAPAPAWQPSGARTVLPSAPVPETAGVRSVSTSGAGTWRTSRGTLPALGAAGRAVLTVSAIGRGRVGLLADSSPLSNALIAEAGNAALASALAGPSGRRVVFAETVHGYGQQRGLAALPDRWKWTLIGLLLAAAVWVASRARRLGPAERENRALPPPRRAYVDAVAAALARTHRPGTSAERVREAVRVRVARRAGLGAEPSDDALTRAAATLGLTDEEVALLTRPAGDSDGDLLLAGQALARINGGSG
jgi:hypothetical protein